MNFIGNAPSQVPTNSDLGDLAYTDLESLGLGDLAYKNSGNVGLLENATISNSNVRERVVYIRPDQILPPFAGVPDNLIEVQSGFTYVIEKTASVSVLLPSNPSTNDVIKFVFNQIFVPDTLTYSVIYRNGQRLHGVLEDLVLDVRIVSFDLIYTDATFGWKVR